LLIRTFIGIFPPAELQHEMGEIQSAFKNNPSPVRWEVERKFHITMKFLGDMEPSKISDLHKILSANLKPVKPFNIRIVNIGFFPSVRLPQIIWIGTENSSHLIQCFQTIEDVCQSLGYQKEPRDFHPHITIGRAKGLLTEYLINTIKNSNFEPMEFMCSEISIMKSTLHSLGSEYSTQFIIPL
jgi:RNA 2',3'-cyclic 3'-phosphodiesterase